MGYCGYFWQADEEAGGAEEASMPQVPSLGDRQDSANSLHAAVRAASESAVSFCFFSDACTELNRWRETGKSQGRPNSNVVRFCVLTRPWQWSLGSC